MAVPTWVPGQVLTASDVNTWFVPTTAIKSGDTSRASNTTPTADPDLVAAVAANAIYSLEVMLIYHGASAAGYIQFEFTVPAGATVQANEVYNQTSGGVNNGPVNPLLTAGQLQTAIPWTGGTGLDYSAQVKGVINTAATPGSLTLLWSQNISNATATTLKQNSFMALRRIG